MFGIYFFWCLEENATRLGHYGEYRGTRSRAFRPPRINSVENWRVAEQKQKVSQGNLQEGRPELQWFY
jgi:hypothetical protein